MTCRILCDRIVEDRSLERGLRNTNAKIAMSRGTRGVTYDCRPNKTLRLCASKSRRWSMR